MKKFGVMLALSATVCGGIFAAEEVLKLSKEDDFPKLVNMVKMDGEMVFESAPRTIISTKSFKVDLEKTYLLKGSFRNLSKNGARLLFGFVPLDSAGKEILPQNVNCVKGTEAELAEATKIGDTEIKLKGGAGWEGIGEYWVVAFNAQKDLSDLPNRDLSAIVDSVSGNGVTLTVTLSKPIKKAYPAGTKVRAQHYGGGTYLYSAARWSTISDQWQEFSGKIQGKGWRLGTTKANIFVQHRNNDHHQAKIQFKDISVEMVD